MEEQILTSDQVPETAEVVDIQFRPGQKVYFFDPAGQTYEAGNHVIIDTARGPEYGVCTAGNHTIPQSSVVSPLRPVLRIANARDEKIIEENRAKERKAHAVCLQKIEEQGLDMQLVSAEYAFDGSKILFFFTADERVDFRELVKSLASVFHTRIELRQIGVRDKAKMVGGLGICGRPFCCATFLDDFQPVSIKMAKTQNLSLNPTKISGTCGRLMCCLKYEQDAYEDLLRTAPKPESFVDTPEGRGTVVEVDLLRQRVKVRLEEQQETITTYPNSEIAVLRNGKAKKNDPPIPADLAPISGSGKRVPRKEEEDTPVFLDPIKFRYSTESVVDETPAEKPVEEPETEEKENRRPHRRRKPRAAQPQQPKPSEPKSQQPRTQEPKSQENKSQERKPQGHKPRKPAAPKEPQMPREPKPGGEKEQKQGETPKENRRPRRRSNYHRRKPKTTGTPEA